MKRSLVFIIVIMFGYINCYCQNDQGGFKNNYIIGGTFDINVRKANFNNDNISLSDKLTSMEFSPNFAYFASNKLALGMQINTYIANQKFLVDGSTSKSITAMLGPYVRYYFYKGLFVETGLGLGAKKTSFDNWSIVQGKINLGYSVFIKKMIALEPIFSFSSSTEKAKNDYRVKYQDFNLSLSLQTFF